MASDIMECIDDWDYPMKLIVPKPIEEQPNYNKLLREFDGPAVYDEYSINGEYRSKAENKQLSVESPGDAMIDKSVIVLPSQFIHGVVTINTISLLDQHTLIKTVRDNNLYRIASIRTNVGQISIECIKLVGIGGEVNGYIE